MCSAEIISNLHLRKPGGSEGTMVHEQEEGHHSSRKRSNPFIQWLESESPPHSRTSSDTESQSDQESFSVALPSPPLQSNPYTTFKQEIDKFGGSWKKEEDRTQTCWTSRDNNSSSARMSPSCQKEICKKRNSDYGETFSETEARHESDTSVPQESDEPQQKKARYSHSLEIKNITEETFHPTIAEKIKLSKRERKYSQSYDESPPTRPFPGKESKKSPRQMASSHPYIRRQDTQARQPSPPKIFIQIPSLNLSESQTSDKNHNKLSESEMSSYLDSRHTSQVYPVHIQPSSEPVSSTTEPVRTVSQASMEPDSSQAPEEAREVREVRESGPTKLSNKSLEDKKTYSQVTLQPHQNQTQTFWQLREKERSGSLLTDRNYKQICRSRKFNTRYPAPEKPRQKRAVIQDMVRPLKQWLLRHRHNPYPTKAEKLQLAVGSNMTLVQVSNWFANARRRLKNVVQESRCSWSKRLRLYNQCVQGNAELLSISSDDSIWNSEDEEDDRQSDTGNTEEYDLDENGAVEVVVEHSYSRGQQAGSVTSRSDGEQEGQGKSVSSLEDPSLHISDAASPTDTSETSPASPSPSPHNISDTNKYKKNMLWRYLKDAAEAAESFSKDRTDLESSLSEQEERDTTTDILQLPPASNNITISFTNSSVVPPVISQPPRDEMGDLKVKRQLADRDSQPGCLPPQHEFSPLSLDLGLAASEEVRTLPLSQPEPVSAPQPPPTIFSPLRHCLSVMPLVTAPLATAPPGPYPYYQVPSQPTLNTWPPAFTPNPYFLHLIPDSNCSELGPGLPGSVTGAASAGSGLGWVERTELDAAVALSQLAHSAQGHCPPAPPIIVSSGGSGVAATLMKPGPPPCT